ncbi:unnamed protein product, partial [Tenebrio molitor]
GTRDKNGKFTAVGSVVSAWGESRGQSSCEFAGLTRRRSEVHEGRWRGFVQVLTTAPNRQADQRLRARTSLRKLC